MVETETINYTIMYNDKDRKNLRRKLRKSLTPFERIVWGMIRGRRLAGLKFYRQYSIGKYVLDFYCPDIRLCLEIDGGQHLESENKINDKKRTEFLNSLNIRVLRFYNNDIVTNLDGVYQRIYEVIRL